MIYLFYGSDGEKARGKWRQVLAAFHAKYPTGQVFHFEAEHFNLAQLEELAQGEDLFGGKRLVVGDRLLEHEAAVAWVTQNLPLLIQSATHFIFLEADLAAELAEQIKTAGGRVEQHEAKERAAEKFNLFLLTNALAGRERKKLWLLCQQALAAGVTEEEIFWKLVWQIKTLLLVKNSPAPPSAMKPFVLEKTRQALGNFKSGELENLSAQLVALWHDARRGQTDFDLGLEKLVLSV